MDRPKQKDMDRTRRHWQSTLYKFYQNFVWLNVIGHIVFKTHHYGIGWLVIQCDVPADSQRVALSDSPFPRQFVTEGQRLMKCTVGHMTEFFRKTSWFYRSNNLKSYLSRDFLSIFFTQKSDIFHAQSLMLDDLGSRWFLGWLIRKSGSEDKKGYIGCMFSYFYVSTIMAFLSVLNNKYVVHILKMLKLNKCWCGDI